MSATETMVGVIGEFMLFLTAAFLVVAVATALLAMDGDAKEYVAIGMPFVVAAGSMYTARDYLEKRQWKRLSMTTLIVVVALGMSGVGTADVTGATLGETVLGSFVVAASASIVTFIIYVLRIYHLCLMYLRKRTIVKSVQSGNYAEAVKVAEGRSIAGTNYVKSPEKISVSVARALACALGKVGREIDAERVRLVSESRHPLRS